MENRTCSKTGPYSFWRTEMQVTQSLENTWGGIGNSKRPKDVPNGRRTKKLKYAPLGEDWGDEEIVAVDFVKGDKKMKTLSIVCDGYEGEEKFQAIPLAKAVKTIVVEVNDDDNEKPENEKN